MSELSISSLRIRHCVNGKFSNFACRAIKLAYNIGSMDWDEAGEEIFDFKNEFRVR
jgi:hypothetical protein